jgi:putative aldouronate transport system permease protein
MSSKYKKLSLKKQIMYSKTLLLMILFPLAYFAIFCYGPMYGMQIAFKDFRLGKGILGSDWVGFQNFRYLFSNNMFMQAFRNTLILGAYRLIFVFPVPIIFALMLNEMKLPFVKKFLQTVIYLPHFISAVIAASLVTTFLSPDYGIINDVIRMLGGEPTYFLIEKSYFRIIVILAQIWKGAGWGTIVYLAALAGVDGEVLEASIIDGATRIQRIIFINIPSIMSVVVIMFILAVGSIISSDFEMILNLYNLLVYETGDVLDTYIFRVGLQAQGRNMFSASTAANMFKSVVAFFLIALTNKAASRLSEGEMRIW